MELINGGGVGILPCPPLQPSGTFMALLFGQLPCGYSLTAPTSCLSSLFTFKCHHYCVACTLQSAQEAGPVSSLQLVLGEGSSPSS